MGYNEEYKRVVEEYEEVLGLYNAQIQTQSYKDAQERLCFGFLEAKQKAEMLSLYKQLGEKSELSFRSADEAASFYISLGEIKKSIPQLLDGAACVEKANDYLDRLNDLVDKSPYLSSDLKVEKQEALADLAKECLAVLPGYPKLVTRKFRECFVEGCARSLSAGGLTKLAQMGILKKTDIDTAERINPESGEVLCNFFGEVRGAVSVETLITRLRGVSYSNDDGKSRQSLLSEIKKSGYTGPFETARTKWNDNGVEKPAVEVKKDGNILGYLPQEVVDETEAKYSSPEYIVKSLVVSEFSGTCGAEVCLDIKGRLLSVDKEAEGAGRE